MALPTSNLSVNLIYTTLGVSNGRDLFYIGATLKTAAQLALVVNKNGLNPTYCPGADADARLANLLADRKLSYFKGYEPIVRVTIYDRGSGYLGWSNYYNGTDRFTITNETDHIKIVKSEAAWDYLKARSSTGIDTNTQLYIQSNNLKLNVIFSVVSGSFTANEFLFSNCSADTNTWSATGNVDLSAILFSISSELKYTSTVVHNAFVGFPSIFLNDSYTAFELRIHEIYYE